jgi:hypothetical protein
VKRYRVVFSELARRQLDELYDFIAERAHPDVALGYIARIDAFCRGLETFPERGSLRNEVRPGLRIVGYRRQASIAFTVADATVVILAVFRRGADTEALLAEGGGLGTVDDA